jgi:hypothetical protein
MTRVWEPYVSPKGASPFGFRTLKLMAPQPLKAIEVRSRE